MTSITGKRAIAITMAFAMIIASFFIFDPVLAASTTTVKIGQATNDENGGTRGGKAGDQKGGEVSISKWTYSSKSGAYNNWKYVIRAKDPNIAKALADAMKKTCANNHIGYDQKAPDRFSFYDEAKAVNWKIDKITTDCETTCASAVSVCLNSVGITTDRYWDSSLVYNDLSKTGKFNFFSSKEFTASSDLLEAGDILLSPDKHTAMVVESPNSPGSVVKTTAASTSSFKAGKEYQLQNDLQVRSGAGILYPAKTVSKLTENAQQYAHTVGGLAVLNKGTVVTCLKASGEWVKIPSGWIRGKSGSTSCILEFKGTSAQQSAYEQALESNRISAAVSSNKITTGSNYVLKKVLNVRKGPGTNYKKVKRKNLTKNAKLHAKKTTYAKLKKGTVVTCLQKKGNWMRIPSGWICCKPGNVKAAN